MDAEKREEPYTIDDIYTLPDGKRRADWRKDLFYVHTELDTSADSAFFDRTIGNYIEDNSGKCEIYPAPFAVFLNNDKTNYVEPDISVICDTSKLDKKGCHDAPDWVIEIVSPSSRSMDYFIKANKYHDAGVREYWIVDSEDKLITVYGFDNEITVEHYNFGEEVPVGIYEGFSIKLSI